VTATSTDPDLVFPFIGGRPCLNFVATLGKRHATPKDRLPDPAALARWLTQAELAAGEEPVRVSARDLADARLLRGPSTASCGPRWQERRRTRPTSS
jgi:hypothetical protein